MILVVDDEEVIRWIVGRVLADRGYEVLSAATLDEACHAWDEHCDRIRLAILDLQMTDGSGWDVAARIWQHSPRVNVIITTGYSVATPPEELAVPEGRLHFLYKPYEMDDLVKTVASLLRTAGQGT